MSGLLLVSYIALWMLFLVVAVTLISILYHLGVIYNRIEKVRHSPTTLTAGKFLPDVSLKALNGESAKISHFRGKQTAFLVVSPDCSGCIKVLRTVASSEDFLNNSSSERLIIVSTRDIPATFEMIQKVQLPQQYPVFVDIENGIEKLWGVNTTPVIIEVEDDLKVAKQTLFVRN